MQTKLQRCWGPRGSSHERRPEAHALLAVAATNAAVRPTHHSVSLPDFFAMLHHLQMIHAFPRFIVPSTASLPVPAPPYCVSACCPLLAPSGRCPMPHLRPTLLAHPFHCTKPSNLEAIQYAVHVKQGAPPAKTPGVGLHPPPRRSTLAAPPAGKWVTIGRLHAVIGSTTLSGGTSHRRLAVQRPPQHSELSAARPRALPRRPCWIRSLS